MKIIIYERHMPELMRTKVAVNVETDRPNETATDAAKAYKEAIKELAKEDKE